MNPLKDLFHRLRTNIGWIAAQFWGLLLLILIGLAWTRLDDRHAWQVLLSLLVPLLLIASFLILQARTMRRFMNANEGRTRFWMSVLMLLGWMIVIWAARLLLDWCDDRIPVWAGYLNSRASAGQRATALTYVHLVLWFTVAEWILRWIAIPGKVIPHAVAAAQWGWRLPWRRSIGVLLNWRWWPAVVLAAWIGVRLPAHFFTGVPHGTVSQQVWLVMTRLMGTYLLAVACWVMLLAWAAVLLAPAKSSKEPGDDAYRVIPAGSGPLCSDAAGLPLPEEEQSAGGNA